MQTSRFQLGLMATMAAGLGFSLSSSQAIGYPAGAAVSGGTNPVLSVAGTSTVPAFIEVVTAPADHDIVITDVALSVEHSEQEIVSLQLSSGDAVARVVLAGAGFYGGGPFSHGMTSGIRVPAGDQLQLRTNWGNQVHYTFSGYYAQP